jgi:hypothetical protein
MVQAAVNSGEDPSAIPAPGTPQFGTWANRMIRKGMTSKESADYLEKVSENTQRSRERQEEFAQREADRHEQMRQTALLRESAAEDRRMRREMERERLDLEKQRLTQPKTSIQAQRDDRAIIASGREAMRGLHVIGAMDNDQTAGPFEGLHNGTILESLSKTGTNTLTPEDMQIYQTATAGLGLEISRAMTLGGGRGANQATINEMQNIVTAHPGDTKATVIFKYANAVDIVRNRLESMSEPSDPTQAKLRQDTLNDLNKIPTPLQVLKTIKDPKQRAALMATQASMADTSAKMERESTAGNTGLPGTPDAGAGTSLPPLPKGGGLPAGWSVTEH